MQQKTTLDAQVSDFMGKFDLQHFSEEVSELLFVRDFETAPSSSWKRVSYWMDLRHRMYLEYENWFVADLARLFIAKCCHDNSRDTDNLVLKARAERAYAGNSYGMGCRFLAERDKRAIKFLDNAKEAYKETYRAYSKNNPKHCTYLSQAYAMLALSVLRLEVPENLGDPS